MSREAETELYYFSTLAYISFSVQLLHDQFPLKINKILPKHLLFVHTAIHFVK